MITKFLLLVIYTIVVFIAGMLTQRNNQIF